MAASGEAAIATDGATTLPRYAAQSIAQDAVFFLRLLKTVIEHDERSLLSLSVVPMASLFVIESHGRLSEHSPGLRAIASPDHLGLIRPARHRTKLLKHNVNELVAEFERVDAEERASYAGRHRGILGPLKRWVQGDLGLFLCGGHVFSTTHAVRVAFGPDFDFAADGMKTARATAEYCALLARNLAPLAESGPFAIEPLPPIKYQDIKSRSLYRRGAFGHLEPAWAAALSFVLANVNFVHRVLGPVVPARDPTFLKLKLLYSFHALESLRLLQDRLVGERRLPSAVADVLRPVIATADSRWLRKQDKLRELLMHIQPARETHAIEQLSYENAVATIAGRPTAELHDLADRQLEALSTALSVGFDLHADTFWYGAAGFQARDSDLS